MVKMHFEKYPKSDEIVRRKVYCDMSMTVLGRHYTLPKEQPFLDCIGKTVPVRVLGRRRIMQIGRNRYDLKQFPNVRVW